MAEMTSSPRPKRRPKNPAQMDKSPRPLSRSDAEAKRALDNAAKGYKAGGKVTKMAGGGMCRGMGAATKGGKFSKNG